jgi:hypothetical protein
MATPSNSVKKAKGPFVAAAFFCENIIQDSSQMMSAIHILDSIRFNIPQQVAHNTPSKDSPIPVKLNMLLMFKTGGSPGKHPMKLVIERPDGKRKVIQRETIDLKDNPNGGVNIRTTVEMDVQSAGVYWVDVFIGSRLMTRMPLSIDTNTVTSGTASAQKK